MIAEPRPYSGLHDLDQMKALAVQGRKVSPDSGYPHRGDLDWWLFYGAPSRGEALDKNVWLWEDMAGELLGWLVLAPPDKADMAVLPRLRGGDLETEMIAWTERQLGEGAKAAGKPLTQYACADETARIALLERRGYRRAGEYLLYFTQSITDRVAEPGLPEGFSFVEKMGERWVETRAAAHFSAFQPSRMTAAHYRHFMTAPDYDPSFDVAVIASDGRCAAFAMGWIDPETRIGSFEPVGTRQEFQRKGLGRAALQEGIRRMQKCGMETATVFCDAEDAGNIRFYESAGFSRTNSVLRFLKGD